MSKKVNVEIVLAENMPVADRVLDEVAAEILHLARLGNLQMALSIGELIVTRLYGGDLQGWRDRGPKDASFRRLSERLPMGAVGLYRSVAVYELCQRLNGGVSTWKHLGVSHLRTVLSLPEPQQKRLLGHAEDRGWTVEKLQTEAAKVRSKQTRKGGRPPLPSVVKDFRYINRLMDRAADLEPDLSLISALERDEVLEITRIIDRAQDFLRMLKEAIQHRS